MEPEQQSLAPSATHGSGRMTGRMTAASRQRLQKVFEHGTRCVEKNDFDYANQLFTQCVVEDPGNLIYWQNFFANLQKKYGDGKKGAKFAGLKIKSHRSALIKSAGKGNWELAFQAACAALALNPWDIPTLLAVAEACGELKFDECQLFCLRWAMAVDAKHVAVNRQAAFTLQRMGQFDQAIACWHRIKQANPQDEEAGQAISRLSVEKTIHEGGYDSTALRGDKSDAPARQTSVAQLAKGSAAAGGATGQEGDKQQRSPEERLKAAIGADPTNVENYLQLADICTHENRYSDAEYVLTRASNVAGGGDLRIRERLEDLLLRRAHQQLAIAEQRAVQDPSEENQQLASRLRNQVNQVELEIFAAKADRDPNNMRLKFELGVRLKQAGKTKEAIPVLQSARDDSRRAAQVLLELGECFQKIEQYKLALSHYEQAIEACDEPGSAIHCLALYRAGVLSTGMREFDRAERHLTDLAGLDYGYRDVAERLDKLSRLSDSR